MAYEQEIGDISDADERHAIMELMTSWERKGRQEGRLEGELAVITRLLTRQIGALEPAVERQIARLSLERLEALAEALLDFTGSQDVDRWLANGKKKQERAR